MTGFAFRGTGAFTAATPLPTLASFTNPIVSSLNLLNWTGHDGKQQNGVYTDFRPTNLVGGTAVWTTSTAPYGSASISTINAPAFDGTPIYFKLVEDSSNNPHAIQGNGKQDKFAFHPVPFRVMVIAGAAERTRIVVGHQTNAFFGGDAQMFVEVGFDLAGGNTGYDVTSGTKMTVLGQQMIDLGTVAGVHWWACIFDWTYNTANTGTGRNPSTQSLGPVIWLDNGSGTAARSTTYTGDGTSGAYIFMAHMMPKAVWTHSWARNFFDDFANLSTVDRNNTQGPGFNWYTEAQFPNATPAGFWSQTSELHTEAGTFSQPIPSVLQMQTPQAYSGAGQSNFHGSLHSVNYIGGTGLASLQGHYFGPPAVLDSYSTYDNTAFARSGYLNNQAFWSVSAETLAGSPLDGSGHYVEWDITDNGALNPGVDTVGGFNYWKGNGAADSGVGATASLINPNVLTFNRRTGLWLDAASGISGVANWGMFLDFFDGSTNYVGNTNIAQGFLYQTAGVTHPQQSGADLAGAYSQGDVQHFMIFLWAPAAANSSANTLGVATLWDWVAVWQ